MTCSICIKNAGSQISKLGTPTTQSSDKPMAQAQELRKPDWFKAMDKFESNFMSRRLISADFADVKEGKIDYKSSKDKFVHRLF